MLGGQSGTHGPQFNRQWAHFGIDNAVLYVATEHDKLSRAPAEYKWLQKKQQDSQGKDTEATKRDLIQKKNNDDAMFVLFSGVFEKQSRRRIDEVWRM